MAFVKQKFEEEKKKIIPLSDKDALLKLQNWCAYQERCQQEVRDKLYDFGLHSNSVENIISELITTGFLNEERFAKAFAGGKFRIKKWGRIKIKIELRKKRVSDYCIKKGLQEIDEKEYLNTLTKLAEIKLKTISEKNALKKKYKLTRYLLSKGFEGDLVKDIVDEMS